MLLLVSCSEIAKIGFDPKGTWYCHTETDSLGNYLDETELEYITLNDSIMTGGGDYDSDGKILDSHRSYENEFTKESISWSVNKDTVFVEGGYYTLTPITRDSVLVKLYYPDTDEDLIIWEVWSKNPPTYHPDWSDAYLNLYKN